jgi:hypothetical protein
MARRIRNECGILRDGFMPDKATGHDGLRRHEGDGQYGKKTRQDVHLSSLRLIRLQNN